MSRVHDALRDGRGRSAPVVRPPRATAVPSALGHHAAERGSVGRPLLIVLLLVAAGAAAWTLAPRLGVRSAGAPPAPTAPSSPVSTPAQSRPVDVSPPPALPAPAPRVPETAAAASDAAPPTTDAGPRGGVRRPASIPTPRTAGGDPFQLALYHHRAGDFEQALLHYKAALQRDELNVEAHNNLGGLYLSRGLLDEAVREFQRVLAIDPEYVTAHVNLSAAYYQLGRFEAAAASAREALRLDPRNVDGFVNLALARKGAGHPADSLAALRRALELDPRHPLAHYNLARQYEDTGEAVRAVEHYRQFLRYAGPEREPQAADVRARLQAVQTRAAK